MEIFEKNSFYKTKLMGLCYKEIVELTNSKDNIYIKILVLKQHNNIYFLTIEDNIITNSEILTKEEISKYLENKSYNIKIPDNITSKDVIRPGRKFELKSNGLAYKIFITPDGDLIGNDYFVFDWEDKILLMLEEEKFVKSNIKDFLKLLNK